MRERMNRKARTRSGSKFRSFVKFRRNLLSFLTSVFRAAQTRTQPFYHIGQQPSSTTVCHNTRSTHGLRYNYTEVF